MEKPGIIIASTLVILTVVFGTIHFTGQPQELTKEDQEKLKDYSSEAYTEVEPSDLGLNKKELHTLMNIKKEETDTYNLTFYKLDYAGISQIHAQGDNPNKENSCFTVALVNADRHINTFDKAGFFFFQSSDPSVTHSCSGDPCEFCVFDFSSQGDIQGCDCNYLGGHCNHTVSTSRQVD